MDTDINPDVSPTFHEANFAEGSEERAVAKTIYTSLTKYHEAVAALNADPTLTPDGRLLQQLRLLEGVVARTTPAIDKVVQGLGEREKSLANLMETRAQTFGTRTVEAWEVRGAITQMESSAKKIEFIRRLAREGDREAIAALGTRPWALGIDMSIYEWASFREGLHRELEPELARRLDLTRVAQQRFEAISKAFMGQYGWKALDKKSWDVARKAEQRRAAVEAARS
jgi:hypothetical protein